MHADDSPPARSGLLQDANNRQAIFTPPMPRKGLAQGDYNHSPSTAFREKCTWLLGVRFDYVGTSNCSFCGLTSAEVIFSCSDLPRCFSQHYLSPKLSAPDFAALLPLSPRAPGHPRQQTLALWTAVFLVETVCRFVASLALFCRDTAVRFAYIPKQKAVAAAADAADGDSAPALPRPP